MVEVASSLGQFLPGAEPQYLAPGLALHSKLHPDSCWFCTSIARVSVTMSGTSQNHKPELLLAFGRSSDDVTCEQAANTGCIVCGIYRAGEEVLDQNGEFDLAKTRANSVVGRTGQVWGIGNLYLGGCGVIPTGNATNPTLTAACHAIAGADQIIKELKQ